MSEIMSWVLSKKLIQWTKNKPCTMYFKQQLLILHKYLVVKHKETKCDSQ